MSTAEQATHYTRMVALLRRHQAVDPEGAVPVVVEEEVAVEADQVVVVEEEVLAIAVR